MRAIKSYNQNDILFLAFDIGVSILAWYLTESVEIAILLGTFLSTLWSLVLLKRHKRASGLSEEEYMLLEAGGAKKLLAQASLVRAISWIFFVLPVLLVIVAALAIRSVAFVLSMVSMLGILCIPFAVYCYKDSSKRRLVAESALAKEKTQPPSAVD
jgi:hypothetical protein